MRRIIVKAVELDKAKVGFKPIKENYLQGLLRAKSPAAYLARHDLLNKYILLEDETCWQLWLRLGQLGQGDEDNSLQLDLGVSVPNCSRDYGAYISWLWTLTIPDVNKFAKGFYARKNNFDLYFAVINFLSKKFEKALEIDVNDFDEHFNEDDLDVDGFDVQKYEKLLENIKALITIFGFQTITDNIIIFSQLKDELQYSGGCVDF